MLVLATMVAGLAVPGLLAASKTTICDQPPLIATSPQAGAELGWSMAIDPKGPWLAVGAHLADADNTRKDSGSVALYRNPQPGARPTIEIIPTDLQAGDQFGASVSISGDWLAVGAPMGDGRVRDSGVVYLFHREGETWPPAGKLEAADAAKGAQFGASVSLHGNVLVVGAPGDSARGSSAGAAYVFVKEGQAWTQKPKLLANDGRPFDEFASSVSTDGNEIVIGAPFADDLHVFQNFGAAYVFQGNATDGWSFEDNGKLTAGAFRSGNIQFGAAVAILDRRIVVGAPGDDLQGTDSGSAYAFEPMNTGWTRQQISVQDPGPGEQFGASIQLEDGRVLIGARFDGEGSPRAGAAYLFKRQSVETWTQIRKYYRHSAGGGFGQSVAILGDAILGDTVFMGGFLEDVGTEVDAGAVAMCPPERVPPQPCPSISKTDNRDTVCPGDAVTYEITVSNDPSHAAVTGATVVDNFRSISQLQNVAWTCTASGGASCSPPTGGQILRDTINLPPNGEVKYTVKARVGPQATGTIINHASVTLPSDTVSCATADDTTRIPGDLGIEIGGSTQIPEGEVATYTLGVSHSGAAMTGVQVKVEVTGGMPLPSAGCVNSQNGFTCDLVNFPAGPSSVPLELKVRAPGGCPCPAAPITLTATVMANEKECDDSNNTATTSTAVTCTADLALQSFTVVGPSPPQCGTITYKIDYKNLGPGFACGTFLEQSIPAGLTFVSPASCQVVGSNIHCPVGNLPPNGTGTFQTSFAIPPVCQDPIDSTAKISSTTPDPDSSNNFDNGSSAETSCPSPVRITKTDSPDPVVPGQAVVYTITVKNTGASAVSGVLVKDDFPPELRKVLWCRGAGCTPTLSPPLEDTIDLAAGETRIYRLSGIVRPMCSGVLHNKATITPPAGVCNTPSDNQAIEDTQVVATGVHAFCEGIGGSMMESTPFTKTFLLINCGPANQADNPGDEFKDTLPTGLTLTGASATSGVASTSGNMATWNGAIPVGGTVTITMNGTIDPLTAGMTFCNQATIAYDADGNGINESIGFSDDPDEPGPADPCCFRVWFLNEIPALSWDGLAALALLLAGLAVLRLRRRPL
ncbi:MAG: hypothetical protein ACJ76Y_11625 [Thermoanaerobaculia bacterium]